MTGLVLAGGLSSRFGTDKSRVVMHGDAGDMTDFSLALLSSLSSVDKLAISCRPEQMESLRSKNVLLIPDEECGHPTPLRGLIAALRRLNAPVFAIPCDLPLMTLEILNLLVCARTRRLAESSGGIPLLRTTFIDQDGFIESLIGIYEPGSLPFLEQALVQKRWGIWSAVPSKSNCLVSRPDSPAFLNMNTLEEFQHANQVLIKSRLHDKNI